MPHTTHIPMANGFKVAVHYRIITLDSNDAEVVDPARPTVLWFHTALMAHWFWAPNMSATPTLRGYNNVLFDMLGHGQSTHLLPEGCQLEFGADIGERLFDMFIGAQGAAHVVICGSTAPPVVNFIKDNPERCLSLTIQGMYIKDEGSDEVDEGLEQTMWEISQAGAPGGIPREAYVGAHHFIAHKYGEEYYLRPWVNMVVVRSRDDCARIGREIGPEAFYRAQARFYLIDNHELPLEKFQVPTLIIRGEHDKQTSAQALNTYLNSMNQKRNPDSRIRLITIPGGPELPSVEYASEFNAALLTNLSPAAPFPPKYIELPNPWEQDYTDTQVDEMRLRPIHLMDRLLPDRRQALDLVDEFAKVEVEKTYEEDSET